MDELGITIADVIVIAAIVVSGFLAFSRGFVHEVLAVAAWIGAIVATMYGLPHVRPFARQLVGEEPLPVVGDYVSNEIVADVAACAVIFVLTLTVLSMLTGSVSSRVRDSQLNALDRSLGFAFGALRGAVLVSLVYLGIEWLMPPAQQPAWLREARSAPLLQAGADMLRSVAPESLEPGARPSEKVVQSGRKPLETDEVLREMMSPEPRAPGADRPAADGYSDREREQLDRLIESNPGRNQ
ncbi:MAG: CvpA family protein [Rhodospirillales bacterium]|nr:CvpA family protein [Rhodospirillales bacterium]